MKFRMHMITVLLFGFFGHTVFAGGLTLKSMELAGQLTDDQVFSGFGCAGKNISPELHWKDAPKNTKSFAVTVYDPDAPTGSGWWHWVIFDIPAASNQLLADAGNVKKSIAPKGVIQSITDFGGFGFGGACPPKGDAPHQYIFTVHALDVESLGLDKNASAAKVGYYLSNHTLAKASLVSYYGR